MTVEELFIRNIGTIERITAFLCRRNRVPDSDIEDMIAYVKVELLDRDYEIIRKYEGRSAFATYLTTVIHRLLYQYRSRLWGRWRPSAEARRLGEAAITLERLLWRDGFSLGEALQILTTGSNRIATRRELEAIYLRLPHRVPRPQPEREELATASVASSDDSSSRAMREDRDRMARQAARVMDQVLLSLGEEERELLKERFWSERSVADISASMNLDQKRTYKRIDKLLARFRAALEAEGIGRGEAHDLIGDDSLLLEMTLSGVVSDGLGA